MMMRDLPATVLQREPVYRPNPRFRPGDTHNREPAAVFAGWHPSRRAARILRIAPPPTNGARECARRVRQMAGRAT